MYGTNNGHRAKQSLVVADRRASRRSLSAPHGVSSMPPGRTGESRGLLQQKVEGVAWRSKPSSYVVAKNDRSLHPELRRFAARRMRATIYEVASSHVPMLSRPDAVLDVIRTAANTSAPIRQSGSETAFRETRRAD